MSRPLSVPIRPRRPDWAELFAWSVDRADPAPVFRQIYLQICAVIRAKTLRPGMRLPSTRALAQRLGVARASVVAAYEELLADGYLAGRGGSGTYVSPDVPAPVERNGVRGPATRTAPLPAHARVFEELLPAARPPESGPFSTGRTSVDERALEAWRALSQRALRALDPTHLGYSDPRGLAALRAAVCDFLRAARAVRCDPEQVVITSGTQQAFDLAIRVLLRPRDEVWVENPGYPLTHAALRAAGIRLCAVPVDGHGLDVAAGIRTAPRARAVYVTPSHHYPLGVVLSMARRLALLDWARSAGAWIIEDDYDSVFRYGGRPLASLQGLDGGGRVIHVGSLNKTLFPGLRLGYAVVPRAVLGAYVNARVLGDRHPPSLVQAVLADFMDQGHFTAHLRRTRLVYQQARDTLVRALSAQAGGHLALDAPEQGMHLTAALPAGVADVAVVEAAQRAGVATRALSRTYLGRARRSALLLGFTGHAPAAIVEAAARLARVVREAAPR